MDLVWKVVLLLDGPDVGNSPFRLDEITKVYLDLLDTSRFDWIFETEHA